MPTTQFTYLKPPRLLKGWKWLIEWEQFAPGSTEKIRVRKTFDLNRAHFITAPLEREQRAEMILQEKLKEWADISRQKDQVRAAMGSTNIVAAMDVALQFKCKSDREHTRITYKSFHGIFCEWLRSKEWDKLPISAFDRIKAKNFLDWVLLERKDRHGKSVSNTTYNNYIINLRALFFELVERDFLKENPFSNHKPKKQEQKLRHAFDQEDSNRIAQFVHDNDKRIYLAILLISHCGLRISELRRMRVRDIDLDRGLIILGGDQTKNKELAFITIPSTAIPTLKGFNLSDIPSGHLLFGEGIAPHPKKACGRNAITKRFSELLHQMKDLGLVDTIEGYTTYSWKDTGAIAMVRSGMDILAIQKHLRHKSLETTQRYLQSLGIVNRDIRDFKGVIFTLPDEMGEGRAA